MSKLFLLLLLVAVSALTAAPQSGRRITTPRTAPSAPIQTSLNPEPEPETRRVIAPSPLLFLPESLRERQIVAFDSSNFRLADFHGKVVVINLWASWCSPCRREVPEYEKVRKTYAGRDVEFIGLTAEDPRTSSGRVRKFLRDISFSFRLGWADRETALTLMNGKDSIPQTLVIDAGGRIVSHWTGYMPRHSGDKLTAAINQALDTAADQHHFRP